MKFVGKYVIRGLFAPAYTHSALGSSRSKTVFRDSELQDFIKTILPKNMIVYDNNFTLIRTNDEQKIRFDNADYVITSSDIETKSGVNREIYFYIDKNGNSSKLELHNPMTFASNIINL
jgi:hypothetical protein